MVAEKFGASAVYGLGGACTARLLRSSVEGMSARGLIERITREPQCSGPGERTAKVLAELLRGRRLLDVELSRGTAVDTDEGQPIGLDDIVVGPSDGRSGPEADNITLRVSEPFVGGGD